MQGTPGLSQLMPFTRACSTSNCPREDQHQGLPHARGVNARASKHSSPQQWTERQQTTPLSTDDKRKRRHTRRAWCDDASAIALSVVHAIAENEDATMQLRDANQAALRPIERGHHSPEPKRRHDNDHQVALPQVHQIRNNLCCELPARAQANAQHTIPPSRPCLCNGPSESLYTRTPPCNSTKPTSSTPLHRARAP